MKLKGMLLPNAREKTREMPVKPTASHLPPYKWPAADNTTTQTPITMKLHKLLITTLLAAGSLITSNTHAQEALFSANIGNCLTPDAELGGHMIPLGNKAETIGFLILVEQNSYNNLSYNFTHGHTLKTYSITGQMLKDLTGILPNPSELSNHSPSYETSLFPFGNGGFGLEIQWYSMTLNKYQHEYIFFARVGSDWVETKRFKIDYEDKAAIQDIAVFDDGAPPAGTFATFRKESNSVIADVYAIDKAALAPPQITSDLSTLRTKAKKRARSYTATTNFANTGFVVFGLPPGMKFNAATGQINGKPTTKGVYDVVIGATKPDGGLILANKKIIVR